MNKSLRLWIQLVATVGVAVILQSLVSLQMTPQRYEWLFFAALAILTGSFSMKIGSVYASVTIADTFFITTALLFGPAPATLAIALGSFVASWRRGHARDRVAFNTATTSLGIWAGSHVFFLLAGVAPLTETQAPAGQLIIPLLALTAVYFLTNSGLIAVAIGLDARRSPLLVWREHFLWLSANYFADHRADGLPFRAPDDRRHRGRRPRRDRVGRRGVDPHSRRGLFRDAGPHRAADPVNDFPSREGPADGPGNGSTNVGGAPAPVISLENVRLVFGERAVLDGIDLEVQDRETLCILGDPGADPGVLVAGHGLGGRGRGRPRRHPMRASA
jgi:ABC-type multidrug transport system fused ATPase/permease subunit